MKDQSSMFMAEFSFKISFNITARVQKKRTSRKAAFYFFPLKEVSRVIYTEGGKALF